MKNKTATWDTAILQPGSVPITSNQETPEAAPILRKPYFDNLDALRFLCFLSVFFYHSFHTDYSTLKNSDTYRLVKFGFFGNGNIGVNFFFVLSGFLITYLLIREKSLNGQINLKRFWMRRILRIWPLYFCCVAFGFFIFPLLKSLFGQTPQETAHVWTYLLFVNNFDMIKSGLPDASILGALWSVAIEEQFYLLWPLVLYVLPIQRYYIAFVSVIVVSWIFRYVNADPMMHEFHTLSCIGDMAIGAFGAWLISEGSRFKMYITQLKKYQIMVVYILFMFVFFMRQDLDELSPVVRVFERSVLAVLILLIILEQNYALNSFFKLGNLRRFSYLGVISYGLYSLHFVGILITTSLTRLMGFNTQLWQVLILETSLALFITIGLGVISYRVLEQPFLRLKERFSDTKF